MRGWAVVIVVCAACDFTKLPVQPDAAAEPPDAPPADASFNLPCRHLPGYLGRAGTTHLYRPVPALFDYDGAVDACAAEGAYPVVIDDSIENFYVQSFAGPDSWIGYDDLTRETMFRWINDAPPLFELWSPGQPDHLQAEDCAVIHLDGKWSDVRCGELHPTVCECDPSYQPPATPACRLAPSGFETINGRRYVLGATPLPWAEAEAACAMTGAHLVAISDLDENTIISLRFVAADVWLGSSDVQSEGTFRWVNRAPDGYVNWTAGAPAGSGADAEDCVMMSHPSGTWDDVACTDPKPYYCECDPAPP